MNVIESIRRLLGINNEDANLHEFHPTSMMLERQPTSPFGRIVFWVLCGLILTVSIIMYVAEVDVVISSTGEVLPVGNVQVLQPLEIGVVKHIYTKVGALVKQGDVLFEMEPDLTESSLESVEAQDSSVSLELQRLNALMHHTAFNPSCEGNAECSPELLAQEEALFEQMQASQEAKRTGLKSQLAELSQKIKTNQVRQEEAQKQLTYVNTELKRLLPVEDLVPKKDITQLKQQQSYYQSQQAEVRSEAQELLFQEKKLQASLSDVEHEFQNQVHHQWVEAKRRHMELTASKEQSSYRNEKQFLKAPITGTVTHLNVHTEGAVVTPSEVMVQIVDTNQPLEVKVSLQNKDIGLLKVGQPCRIKVDAYDFQKYGMLNGTLRHLSQNNVLPPRGAGENPMLTQTDAPKSAPFTAYISIDKPELKVLDRMVRLKPGMAVRAEVKVGKRRLYEFFLFPLLKAGKESFSVR
ncbi:MAG: HlyD family type I secretion periplasmic adaptor subunit [Vampirovibrionales bacterium]|jgi:hemolysin D|nr:HlyD family type I secretion periplasmic adaptor subunit [Vampirovibrionales bacterium]